MITGMDARRATAQNQTSWRDVYFASYFVNGVVINDKDREERALKRVVLLDTELAAVCWICIDRSVYHLAMSMQTYADAIRRVEESNADGESNKHVRWDGLDQTRSCRTERLHVSSSVTCAFEEPAWLFGSSVLGVLFS